MQVPSHVLMGMPQGGSAMPLTPLGEACLRMDLTFIHGVLEKLGYKDDEGAATEVCSCFWSYFDFVNKSVFDFDFRR